MVGTRVSRLPRLRGMQHVIVLLFAVTGILVGLLAMHTITTITGDHTTHHIAAATNHHADADSVPLADAVAMAHPAAIAYTAAMTDAAVMVDSDHSNMMPGSECDGMCQPGHSMAAMACALALLVLTLVLTLRVIITRWGTQMHRLAAGIGAALPATLAPPAPPSLHVLSISRT